ncbi:MAG: SPOR domain-containing protein [Gammaproteobacteria bacterium]|jgi:cell division protein FtsN|nr:SPOR domain-containing protein [Gammaproteobacteria bacterium]MDH3848815.1 SPOR domain-containing protein [Gammaproteobacteria bacterium]MDH3863690.1 SPOR domain-containing protein [Gammaproteobacteria bacterium]MDH3906142.1 SPOR domain-containing protein [Gammaproteobacteria bacterium]MDH3909610.1 SPOR domain-containing protein [Gammaproteobacteria bacterium]
MAKKRSKRRSARSKKQDYPGWVWMLFGLAIGLSVAFAIYVRDGKPAAPPPVARQPASLESAIDDNGETPTASTPEEKPQEKRFTFYDMLPNFEVVIPEEEPDVEVDIEPRAIVKPGLYILQAGSFTRLEDADRRRAELALQGIESSIQRVTIDDKTYHRVRIGPTDDLQELNMLRSRLRAANIDVIRIRLGE